MNLPLKCRCGAVRGEMQPRRAYTRATCYCKDCRAYALFLGQPGVLDEAGGTDVVPTAPATVRLTAGLEHVACMSLSPKGTLRWYAAQIARAMTVRSPPFSMWYSASADVPPGLVT